jgi:RNA ligase (TIGR02306 family)
VHAARLRGILSQGLIYAALAEWVAGQDVAARLGITKWEPEIRLHMRGMVPAAPSWWTSYDVEPYNHYPYLPSAGEPVYVTEKVHGTCGVFGRDVAADLQQRLVMGIAAHRTVQELDQAAEPSEFFEQERLVDVVAGEGVS